MKRNLTFIILLVCSIASAQNISEVVRYSSDNLQGTARFQGMGGAFGALGGDLSALNINPAGSSIFNNNLATVSASLYNRDNVINYNGNVRGTTPSYLDINQAGGVLVFNSTNPDSGWNKMAIAINYDITEKFDNNIYASGISSEGIDNYFLNFADGVPLGDIKIQNGEFIEDAYSDIGASFGFGDQQAFLGFVGGIIDPIDFEDDSNSVYESNSQYTNVDQEFSRITTGYNNKFTINASSQYKEKISIGASLNFHSIFYTQLDRFTETGYNESSEIQRTTFDNSLLTQGSGFSLNVGAIAKLSELVRIGASYQSPTWYRLEDEISQQLDSDFFDKDPNLNFINLQNPVTIFPTYKLKTPAKFSGSLALIFGKNGLLSFDYGYQDMSNAELGPSSDTSFAAANTEVSNELGAVNSFRLGGEYRIERFSLRAGYRFEESPYKTLNVVGDLEGISGGVGYNFGGSRLDLAINRTEQDIQQRFFNTGINTPANVNGVSINGTLSYTINF